MLKIYWENYWSVIIERGIVSILISGNSHVIGSIEKKKVSKNGIESLEEFEALQEMSSLYCLLLPIKVPIQL